MPPAGLLQARATADPCTLQLAGTCLAPAPTSRAPDVTAWSAGVIPSAAALQLRGQRLECSSGMGPPRFYSRISLLQLASFRVRHYLGTVLPLLFSGYPLRGVTALLGHTDLKTTGFVHQKRVCRSTLSAWNCVDLKEGKIDAGLIFRIWSGGVIRE